MRPRLLLSIVTLAGTLLGTPALAALPAVDSDDYRAAPWIDATPLLDGLVAPYRDRLAEARTIVSRKPAPEVGAVETFWSINVAQNKPYQLQATLRVIGKNCYLYVEAGRDIDDATLQSLVDRLDDKIYAEDTGTFGSEWKPGIDGDERITILMLDVLDGWQPGQGFVGGFYFPLNELSKKVYPNSNEREMVYLDMNPSNPKDPSYLGVIAHEFQHMIHKNHDPKEDKFVNEGMSQLAFHVCGFDHPTQVLSFLGSSAKQLNKWENSLVDYGAVYLFNYYLWTKYAGKTVEDRKAFTRFLVDSQAKNVAGYDEAFRHFGIDMDAKRLFRDWVVANYVNDPAADPRYGYDPSLTCTVHSTWRSAVFPFAIAKERLAPWSTRYLRFAPVIGWYPEKPSAYEKLRIVSRKPASIRWTVNDGKLANEKYWPAGTTKSEDGASAVTPLAGPDAAGDYGVELGPFVGGGRVDQLEYRYVVDGASTDRPFVIDVINRELRARAVEPATGPGRLTVTVTGGTNTAPLELVVIRKLAKGGYQVDQATVKGSYSLTVADYGRATEWVALAPLHFNDADLEFGVAADLVPANDPAALARRAAHYLKYNHALLARTAGDDGEGRELAKLAAADLARAKAALEALEGDRGAKRFRELLETVPNGE